jgi:hypothetical protein
MCTSLMNHKVLQLLRLQGKQAIRDEAELEMGVPAMLAGPRNYPVAQIRSSLLSAAVIYVLKWCEATWPLNQYFSNTQ